MMLQMILKDTCYFLSQSLLLFTPIYYPHVFIVIAHVAVMKGKQARLITVAPWEFGTEKVLCVCVCVM